MKLHEHGQTIDRERSMNMAMAQIGWRGQSGTVYPLDTPPTSTSEPGGFGPIYISVGTWTDLGDGHWGIDD